MLIRNIYSLPRLNSLNYFASCDDHDNLLASGPVDPITYCRNIPGTAFEVSPAARPQGSSAAAFARGNILISKGARQLTLFDGNTPIKHYPVAIGKPSTPTPLGNFAIATKTMNPGGILGTRWMGLNYDTYGIHGTIAPWLIGQMFSNGCIRMHNHNAEELFVLIDLDDEPILVHGEFINVGMK